jgi:hypothetical protein
MSTDLKNSPYAVRKPGDPRALLALVFGGHPDTHVDLRAFKKGAPDHVAMLDTSAPSFWTGVADFLRENADRDVYFGVAGRDGRGRGLANLEYLGAMFVDVDFNKTPPEQAALRIALLDSHGVPPSMIVHSGGGLHLYWSLLAPLDLRTPERRDAVKGLLKNLARVAAGDPASAESARILRVPGTDNYKPEYGEPRGVEIIGGVVPKESDDPADAIASMRYGLNGLFDAVLEVEKVLRLEGKLKDEPEQKARPLPADGAAVAPGNQDVEMTRLARALRGQGFGQKSIAAALWAAVEEGRFPNQPGREPWTRAHCEDKARRVCEKFEPDPKESLKQLILTSAIGIVPRAVRWLWAARIPVGALSLIAGREGHGKTSVAYDTLARITRGQLEGEYLQKPRNVVIVATEDSWPHIIVPRLKAAGADLARVFRVEVKIQDLGTVELSLPDDVPALEALVTNHEVAMVLLDPVISRVGRKLDTHKDAELRAALEPVAGLAERTGCSVTGIIHLNKTATNDPLTAVMGSRAFVAVARAVLFVAHDNEARMLCFVKNNYGPLAKSQTFRIESTTLDEKDPDDGRAITTSLVKWTGTSDRTARDVLEDQAKARKVETPRDRAATWLVNRLKGEVLPVPSRVVKDEASKAGFNERTIKRAAADEGVVMTKAGTVSHWALPSEEGPGL